MAAIDGAKGPGYPNRVLQAVAFQRGDMDALHAAVEHAQNAVWGLARRGFLARDRDTEIYVVGIDDYEVAEQLVVQVLAAICTPQRRQAIQDADGLLRAALEQTRADLIEYGGRSGRVVSLTQPEQRAEVPEGVPSIDALIADAQPPSAETLPTDVTEHRWYDAARAVSDDFEAQADERTRALIEMRFREGKTSAEVADHFTCGTAAIFAHESRTRRALQRDLRKRFPERSNGPATVDALLCNAPFAAIPPPITQARIRQDVLKRTFQEEPRPFARRAAWAVGAGVVAAVAWGLMFTGYLPHPDDDPVPTPGISVVCKSDCAPGTEAEIRVLAPGEARQVAVALADASGRVEPLLVGPTGRSLMLPFGARDAEVRIPYPATVPAKTGPGARAIAVFSAKPLSAEQIRASAAGEVFLPEVVTASVALR